MWWHLRRHAVKNANLAHLIRVDLHSELLQFTVDEQRLQYLEGLDGKLLLVTNTAVPAAEFVQRYKSLATSSAGSARSRAKSRSGRCTTGCPSGYAPTRWFASWR